MSFRTSQYCSTNHNCIRPYQYRHQYYNRYNNRQYHNRYDHNRYDDCQYYKDDNAPFQYYYTPFQYYTMSS